MLVEDHPDFLTNVARKAAGHDAAWTIDWLSPRRSDDWAEYRDAGFLTTLHLPELVEDLATFWPRGGPQWDALGLASDGTRVLVEAKAHVAELRSTCGAGADSLKQIRAAMDRTKARWGAESSHDWTAPFYQYANRLTHLDFLQQHGVKAILLFVYFVGDRDMRGPDRQEEWEAALAQVYTHLGVSGDLSTRGVVNAYLILDTVTAVA